MSDNFCILPFVHLATHPNGDVTPCCESHLLPKNGSKKLELNSNTIDEIRNSQSFLELKKSFKENKKHKSCNVCWDRESNGIESRRERENKKHGVNQITKGYFIEKQPLLNVELRLGNICNAKCVICHPFASSKWNEDITDEIRAIDEGYSKAVIENTWFRDNDFYDSLLEKSDQIKHIWFNGGEPLLIREHLAFLNKLTDLNITQNIELEYHTNGTLITSKIIELWQKFKFVKITLSLDDILDRYHYARFPLTFDRVENAIELLKINDIYYDIIPTVNLLNVYNTTNIYEYFNNKYHKKCRFNYLRFPKFQSIVNLPEKIKSKILKDSRLPKKLYEELKYELYSVEGNGLTKAVNFYRTLDKQRGVNLEEYLPEWKNYLVDHE